MKYSFIIFILSLLVLPSIAICEQNTYSKWNLEVSQSFFRPTHTLFQQVYGHAFPTFVGISIQPKKALKFMTGIRFFKKSGHTVLDPTGSEIPPNKVSLTGYSIPFDGYYSMMIDEKVHPYFFGGVSYNFYKESWNDLAISNSKNGFGYEFGMGLVFYTRPKWSLSSGFLFSHASVKNSADAARTPMPGFHLFLNLTYALK